MCLGLSLARAWSVGVSRAWLERGFFFPSPYSEPLTVLRNLPQKPRSSAVTSGCFSSHSGRALVLLLGPGSLGEGRAAFLGSFPANQSSVPGAAVAAGSRLGSGLVGTGWWGDSRGGRTLHLNTAAAFWAAVGFLEPSAQLQDPQDWSCCAHRQQPHGDGACRRRPRFIPRLQKDNDEA